MNSLFSFICSPAWHILFFDKKKISMEIKKKVVWARSVEKSKFCCSVGILKI